MPEFAMDEDEMTRLRQRIDTIASQLSDIVMPANPGMGALGIQNLVNALDAFTEAAGERTGAAAAWCTSAGSAVEAAKRDSWGMDAFLRYQLVVAFNEDRY